MGRPGYSVASGGSSLLTGLVSAWPFETDAVDAHGANDLTNNNGITFVAKGVGAPANMPATVANIVAASSQFFSRAYTAELNVGTGGTGGSIAAWVNFTSSSSFPIMYGFDIATGKISLAILQINTVVRVRATSSAAVQVDADWGGAINDGAWHLVVAWFDPTDKIARISVDDGTPVATVALAVATLANMSPSVTRIGIWTFGNYTGLMSSVLTANRAWTAGERTLLYSSGVGAFYPFAGLS